MENGSPGVAEMEFQTARAYWLQGKRAEARTLAEKARATFASPHRPKRASEIARSLSEALASVRVGDPKEPGVTMGPLVDGDALASASDDVRSVSPERVRRKARTCSASTRRG